MTSIITHLDSDGVISAYLIHRYVSQTKKILFSNPSIIMDSIARSIIGETNLDRLYITDIAGNDHAVHLSSVYARAVWIDHHQWSPDRNYENVEIYIMQEPSAAQVVANVYHIDDNMVEMANHIDQNDPVTQMERDFRDLISAIRLCRAKIVQETLQNLIFDLASRSVEKIINENYELIDGFRKYVEGIKKRIENGIIFLKINGYRIAIVETNENIPVYKIQEAIDPSRWDVLAVKYIRSGRDYTYTKLEFRSKGPNILKIARAFGGGGHALAAGASLNGVISLNDIVNALSLFL